MRARAGRLGAARAAGCLGYIPWRMSSRCCLQRAESATLIHADDAAGRLGSGAERRRLSAGRRSPGEDRGRHTAAYNGQRVRPGYMLTMPPEGWDRQRGGAGGALDAAAPARTGAQGADALVENQARARIHATHHGRSGGGPEPKYRRYQYGLGPARRHRWRTGAEGHRGARRRSHEPTAVRPELGLGWPRSTLRWTGTTVGSITRRPNGARREMQAGCGWIGLKAEIHGGPGRAGPRTKMCR